MAARTPRISIVIPVYNGADYLARAIVSALAQTHPETEVLVVNDGSDDDGATQRVAAVYGSRIRYFEKPNGGAAAALNYGLDRMTGEYFSWLSHDDEYGPRKLENQLAFLAAGAPRDAIVFTDFTYIDSRSRPLKDYLIDPANLRGPLAPVVYGFINGCTLLIPRHCFAAAGQFDERLATCQDYDLWLRLARRFPFVHLADRQVRYRLHAAQTTLTYGPGMQERDRFHRAQLASLTRAEILAIEPDERHFRLKQLARMELEGYRDTAAWLRGELAPGPADSLRLFALKRLATAWRNHYGPLTLFTRPRLFWRSLISRTRAYVPAAC